MKKQYTFSDVLLVMSYVFIAWALFFIAFVSPDYNQKCYSVHIETDVDAFNSMEGGQFDDRSAVYSEAFISSMRSDDFFLKESGEGIICRISSGREPGHGSKIVDDVPLSDLEYDSEAYESVIHKINNQKVLSILYIVIGIAMIALINSIVLKKCIKPDKKKLNLLIKTLLIMFNMFAGGFILNFTVGVMSLNIHHPDYYTYGVTVTDISRIIASEFIYFEYLFWFLKWLLFRK